MPRRLFSIGHSNLPLDQFLDLLARHRIRALVDVRRFPGSRKLPHFNRPTLAAAVRNAGIEYHWLEELGGRRRKAKGDSVNLGLRNEGFRNYADYMLTEDFRQGVTRLLKIAGRKPTSIMCAEALYWRCHRRLVSDFLLANGIGVRHIFSDGKVRPHQLTQGAKAENGQVTFPLE